MIEENAVVINVERLDNSGDTGTQKVTVTSGVKSACGSCKQVDQCGTGQISKALPQKRLSLTLISELPVQVGDEVVIGIIEKQLFETAWQVYLLPLLGLFSFAAFGQWLSESVHLTHELFTIFSGVFGGYVGFKLAQKIQRKKEASQQLEATLLRVANLKK